MLSVVVCVSYPHPSSMNDNKPFLLNSEDFNVSTLCTLGSSGKSPNK